MDMYHLIISCAAMAFQSYAPHPTPPPKKEKKSFNVCWWNLSWVQR